VRKVLVAAATFCAMISSLLASGGGCGGGGGGGGDCGGFGGDSGRIFELPTVEEDVDVAGLTLKLDRTKWGYSVLANSGNGPLARFVGEDIEITLRQIAAPPAGGRALAEALSTQAGVLYARPVSTSGAMHGVKAAYGIRRGSLNGDQTIVRYFLNVPGRNWLCFEARPTGKAPQWRDANDLVLGAKLDRSRS
jgi:hypothetical protein